MKRRAMGLLSLLGLLLASPMLAAEEKPLATEQAPEAFVKAADTVAKEVETLRGWKFKEPVKKALCTPDGVRAYIAKQIDKYYPAGKTDQVQAALRLAGLIPETCDLRATVLDLLQGQVEGFYDTDSKTLYLVKRKDVAYDGLLQRVLMAHELTHALDDQYLDLDKLIETGERLEDTDLAHSAVAEGSATSLMMRYMMQAQAAGGVDQADLEAYMKEEAEQGRSLLDAPPYFHCMMASYVCGMYFLNKGNLLVLAMPTSKGVADELLAAAKDPPASTEQILHPEKYWDAEKRDPPVTVTDADVEKAIAPPGYQVVHRDTFGEILAAVVTQPKDRKPNLMLMGLPTYWTCPAAIGWGGDRFYVLAAGKTAAEAAKHLKDLKGVWVTLWDTPQDRDEFVQAYESNAPAALRGTSKLGSLGAVFFFGFTDAEREAAEKNLNASPPKFRHGEKTWTPWAL